MTTLIPREARLARANLDAFIENYRSRGAWGLGEQPFDDDAWPQKGVAVKGKSGYQYLARSGFNAKQHQTKKGHPSTIPVDLRMPPLYREFAKAVLSHLHLSRPSTAIQARVKALVGLLGALENKGDPDPTEVSVADLEATCDHLRESGVAHAGLAHTAGQLVLIWATMVKLELVQAPADWASPIRNKTSDGSLKLGQEFDAARRKKLPDPMALEACASLFQRDDTDLRTTFISSYVALAMCAPERSVEFRFAPADLLDPWVDPKSGEEGVTLRWFPAKGAAPQTKNLDLGMSHIACRVHQRLYALSKPARELARWYEANPTRVYLQQHMEYLRDKETIDINEAHAILYGGEVRILDTKAGEEGLARNFLKNNQVPVRPGVGRRGGGRSATLAFADLEQAVLRQLPDGFPVMDPETGMKYSEALCVLRRRELAGTTSGFMPAMLQPVSYAMIAALLGGGRASNSIFAQHGFVGANGEALSLRTHQMRHYLNTIVRRGGSLSGGKLTEDEIAIWSGRKDVNQNFTYDNQSASDKLHELEVRLGFHSDIQPFGDLSNRVFIKRNMFGQIEKITAHLTDIGYCLHDYMQSPCPIAKNCIQCKESVCIKGDKRSRKTLDLLYADSHALTVAAQRDMEDGMPGADEWFKAHLEREGVIKNLLEIFDRPDIPDGTPIILNVRTPNRIKESMARRTIPPPPVAAKIQSLVDVTRLLSAPANDGKELPDVA